VWERGPGRISYIGRGLLARKATVGQRQNRPLILISLRPQFLTPISIAIKETETASIQVHVAAETQKRLKMLAAEEGAKIRELKLEAMKLLFKDRGINFSAE
jgi:hypothetical protein